MSRVCNICGAIISNTTNRCHICNNLCAICGRPLNGDGECDFCKKDKKYREVSKYLTKILVILGVTFAFTLIISFLAISYGDEIINKFKIPMNQHQISSDVLITSKKAIKKLEALKVNKADIYKLDDSIKDPTTLIIRYQITVNFNLDKLKIESKSDGSYILEFPYPELAVRIEPGSEFTENKNADDKPGLEIFYVNKNMNYKIGDLDEKAQTYIDQQVKENQKKYATQAFNNIQDKMTEYAKNLNLNISEIRMEAEKQ